MSRKTTKERSADRHFTPEKQRKLEALEESKKRRIDLGGKTILKDKYITNLTARLKNFNKQGNLKPSEEAEKLRILRELRKYG